MKIQQLLIISIFVSTLACNLKEDTPHHHAADEEASEERENEYWISRKQFTASNFKEGKLAIRRFGEFITVAGEVHVPERNRAGVSSLMGGRVNSFDWIEGQWVTKGQEVLTLNNPDLILLQESYFLLKENNEYLKSEFNRIKALSDSEITARKNFLKVATDLNSNEVQLKSVEGQLQMYGLPPDEMDVQYMTSALSLKAPISGYITAINALQGSYLEAGINALTIANNHHMHLELNVLESDVGKIEKGQKIYFFTQDDYKDTLFAEVHLVNALLGEDRMLKIHCHIEKESRVHLKPGMYATAHILISDKEQFALPETAVAEKEGHSFVLAKVKEQSDSLLFERLMINTGVTQEGFTVIEDTAEFKDRIILTSGIFYLIGESGAGHSH